MEVEIYIQSVFFFLDGHTIDSNEYSFHLRQSIKNIQIELN